jgi:hypothetical protein
MDQSFILDRLILAGGPPRSGTTLLAKLLNSHSEIVTAIDNDVYECFGLYYYRSRVGLVQQLRISELSPDETQRYLLQHIVRDDSVWGIAPSEKVASYPLVPPPIRPDSIRMNRDQAGPRRSFVKKTKQILRCFVPKLFLTQQPSVTHQGLTRHRIPLELFRKNLYLCLKSPETVFVLPQLATALPKAKFVLVHRPVIEIAESMYRKGFDWQLPSYHRRWAKELDENGNYVAPPGVPEQWHTLWQTVSDFQRCIIYATSYLRSEVFEVPKIPSDRVFLYDHTELRATPAAVLESLAKYLDVDFDGFEKVIRTIQKDVPVIARDLKAEYDEIESQIGVRDWAAKVASLDYTAKKNNNR